jgi:alginate O-acetyltransferase complex protein AlgI
MGITLMDNFNNPYFAPTILEFWKRWHISLTNWFREYVYFSLGGNKVGVLRWIVNILLVFALSGIWHGASWNFVCWGIAHGVLYLLETPFSKIEIKNKIILGFMILINFVLVSLLWVFFRAKDIKTVKIIFMKLISQDSGLSLLPLPNKIPIVLLLFCCFELFFNRSRVDKTIGDRNVYLRWTFYIVIIVFVFLFSEIKTRPFIYFQF